MNDGNNNKTLTLRIFQFLILPLDLLLLAFAVSSSTNVVFQLHSFYFDQIQVSGFLCSFSNLYVFPTQDAKILIGLLSYSITSLTLNALLQFGLYTSRRMLMVPYMTFLSLLMMSAIIAVLFFGFSPLVYLVLLPWTCILTLVRKKYCLSRQV